MRQSCWVSGLAFSLVSSQNTTLQVRTFPFAKSLKLRQSAATDINYGIALGYLSTIVPVVNLGMEVHCQFEKSDFAGMDTAFTARVHIANFHRHCLMVTAGPAHRRSTCGRVEVLDESSSWRGPRVIMEDCIHQPNNCMPTTDSYGVCCNIEREDSWISSKRRVAAPQASARNSFHSCKRPRRRTASHIIGNMDSLLFLDNVLGLPTVGWALHAPTQIQREPRPASTIEELLANAEACHKRLISRARLLKIAG